MLTVNTLMGHKSTACPTIHQLFSLPGRKYCAFFSRKKLLPSNPCSALGAELKVSASRKSNKKFRENRKSSETKYLLSRIPLEDKEHISDGFSTEDDGSFSNSDGGTLDANIAISSPSRGAVLQACIVTSGFLLALGAMIRQL